MSAWNCSWRASEMHALLERDYDAMAMMITGVVRPFVDVMKAIGVLEQRLNAAR